LSSKEKIKEIYEVLPKLNCGFCGLGSCGQFARAVAEGKASPFSCQQNLWVGYKISEIIGAKAPKIGYRYAFYQPILAQRPEPLSSVSLKEEVSGLSQRVDNILARIEKLGK